AVGPDGSLYIGDTDKGRIWRIIYTGETQTNPSKKMVITAAEKSPALVGNDMPGAKVYQQICAVCHMANGGGVPNMQPALSNSPVVAGDSDRLINVILKGPAAVLAADRAKYSNV